MTLTSIQSSSDSKFIRWMFRSSDDTPPPLVFLTVAVIMSGAVFLPYLLLIQVSMLAFTIPSILVLFAFLSFKIDRPGMERPYNLPGGVWGAALLITGPFLANLANAYFTLETNVVLWGVPYIQTVAIGFVLIASAIVHVILVGCFTTKREQLSINFQDPNESRYLIAG